MKTLLIYSKKRFKSLSRHLLEFKSNSKSDNIHGIRLEIKKIKTLLHVTNFCVKGFKKHKRFAPFRTIFKRAGKIRQTDVFNKLCHDYNINEMRDSLERSQPDHSKLISDFQNEVQGFLEVIKDEKRKLTPFFKQVKNSVFNKYLDLKREELRKRFYPKFNERGLHESRKILKEIMYLSTVSEQPIQGIHEFYDKLQIVMGQWHDKQIVIRLLRKKSNSTKLDGLMKGCNKDIQRIKKLVFKFYHTESK